MALRIHTNIASLNAQRQLLDRTHQLGRSLERQSSGLRIARASDDAAGLGISERMRARIRSFGVAMRNVEDGVSLTETMESALGEISGLLMETRELAMQGSNGTLSEPDREIINTTHRANAVAMRQLLQDIKFNGISLLNGPSSLRLQVGIEGDDAVTLNMPDIEDIITRFEGTTMVTQAGRNLTLSFVDQYLPEVSQERANLGAAQNRLKSMRRSLGAAREAESAAESRIRDVDLAEEASNHARQSVLQQAAVAVLAQANAQPNLALSLLGP